MGCASWQLALEYINDIEEGRLLTLAETIHFFYNLNDGKAIYPGED